jgi:hypothetical protein
VKAEHNKEYQDTSTNNKKAIVANPTTYRIVGLI